MVYIPIYTEIKGIIEAKERKENAEIKAIYQDILQEYNVEKKCLENIKNKCYNIESYTNNKVSNEKSAHYKLTKAKEKFKEGGHTYGDKVVAEDEFNKVFNNIEYLNLNINNLIVDLEDVISFINTQINEINSEIDKLEDDD